MTRKVAMGMLVMSAFMADTHGSAMSPRFELMEYKAIHPLCGTNGAHIPVGLAERYCAIVASELIARGYHDVLTVPVADGRLAEPGHIVLGFVLSQSDGHMTVTGLLSRVDRPSGALLPPPAECIRQDAAGGIENGVLHAAASRLLSNLGL